MIVKNLKSSIKNGYETVGKGVEDSKARHELEAYQLVQLYLSRLNPRHRQVLI